MQDVTEDWIQRCIKHYEDTDDVFRMSFLECVIFYGVEENGVDITQDAKALLTKMGTLWIRCLARTTSGVELQPGPYVIMTGRLRDVSKLYRDMNGAFFSAYQHGTNEFVPICCNIVARDSMLTTISICVKHISRDCDSLNLSIAVPSRLKVHNSDLPMAGLRIAVKDNFDLQGTKTSLCSRPYYETYPAKYRSASCIQTLLDRGAIIVGKTKLTSFGTWEEPTESIDYLAPWNPRADGYLSAGGSSNGSGVAIAAYKWLDIAIGSDSESRLILYPSLNESAYALTSVSYWQYNEVCPLERLFLRSSKLGRATHRWPRAMYRVLLLKSLETRWCYTYADQIP